MDSYSLGTHAHPYKWRRAMDDMSRTNREGASLKDLFVGFRFLGYKSDGSNRSNGSDLDLSNRPILDPFKRQILFEIDEMQK